MLRQDGNQMNGTMWGRRCGRNSDVNIQMAGTHILTGHDTTGNVSGVFPSGFFKLAIQYGRDITQGDRRVIRGVARSYHGASGVTPTVRGLSTSRPVVLTAGFRPLLGRVTRAR